MAYTTIEQVEEEFKKIYLIEDQGVIRITLASVLANLLHLTDRPVWLLLVAASSGGKSMILQSLEKIRDSRNKPLIHLIDTLTTNTFASGIAGQAEQKSLLWTANGGILVFKDFTTITTMNEEGLREIMGQMRAIFDGTFEKKTGNGVNPTWVGQVGIIAGGTVASQRKMRQFSEQGERFINYFINQPDRKDVCRLSIKNQKDIKEKENHLKDVVAEFVDSILNTSVQEVLELTAEEVEELINVTDFCTLARSPVLKDLKTRKVIFVPPAEMPMRMANMTTSIAVAMMYWNADHKLSDLDRATLFKTCFDSIPADRRLIIRILTKHKSAGTKAIAIKLNYPTDTVGEWCQELNALGLANRIAKGDGSSDAWELKKEYRELVSKYESVEMSDEMLTVEDDEEDAYEEKMSKHFDEADQMALDSIDWGAFRN